MESLLLPLLLIVPLAGAVITALLPSARAARTWSLLVSVATLAVGVLLAMQFDWRQNVLQLPESEIGRAHV